MSRIFVKIIIGILLVSCSQEANEEINATESHENPNLIIGTWESVKRVYPYKSYLLINKDRTFHFEYGACTARGVSNGKWIMKDGVMILNSYKIDSCMFLSHFEVDCKLIINYDTSEYIVEKTIVDCNPKNETYYIEFQNEEFYIDIDTLKHIVKKFKTCPETKNDFLRIIKDTTDENGYYKLY
jgi:hypothetical protein